LSILSARTLGSLMDIAVFIEHPLMLLYYNNIHNHTKSQEVYNPFNFVDNREGLLFNIKKAELR